jgi:excisionase family DNA binding protein
MIAVASIEDLEAVKAEIKTLRALLGTTSEWYTTSSSPLGARVTRRLVAEGKLPAFRPAGRKLFLRRVDVDEYIAAHPVRVDEPEPMAELPPMSAAEYASALAGDVAARRVA